MVASCEVKGGGGGGGGGEDVLLAFSELELKAGGATK